RETVPGGLSGARIAHTTRAAWQDRRLWQSEATRRRLLVLFDDDDLLGDDPSDSRHVDEVDVIGIDLCLEILGRIERIYILEAVEPAFDHRIVARFWKTRRWNRVGNDEAVVEGWFDSLEDID